MKLLILLVFLGLYPSSLLAQGITVFKPKTKQLAHSKITKYKNKGELDITHYHRDSEGDIYVLIHTKGTFPKINNIPTCRQVESCIDDELYTMARLSPVGKLIWAINMKKSGPSFWISDFNVSPQGNVALTISFQGQISMPHALKSFKSNEIDTLVLFYKKNSGALLKTLHFNGSKNEEEGKVIYGTGGEVLFSLKSNSPSVTYDHGKYYFANGDPKVKKRLLISLKENLFPKWFRSVEPDALSTETFYDEGHLLLGLNLSMVQFGIFKPGQKITSYFKGEKPPTRGVVLSLDREGNKLWDIELKHGKYANSIYDTKAFPDGSLGVYAKTQKIMNIGMQGAISTDPSPVLIKFNKQGLLSNYAIMKSNPKYKAFGKHTDPIVLSAKPKQEDTSQFITNDSTQSLNFAEKMECENLLILDKDLKVEYKQDNEVCLPGGKIEDSKITITEGHLEVLNSDKKTYLSLYRFKYGEEGLSEEIIPGLAYTPNFIHEEVKGEKPKYSISYALPEKVVGAMVYFVPKGEGHKEFLLNPLVQSSLNLTYFRGYATFTVWSEDEKISGKRMESLFKGLIKDKVISLDWKWYMQAYGERATQVADIYPYSYTGTIVDRVLDPKALILWNPPALPSLEWGKPEEEYERLAKRSRPTLLVTSNQDPLLRKKAQRFHQALLDEGRVSSHIHQDPQLITKNTFSTLFLMGKERSEIIFNDLKEKKCLREDGRFQESFASEDFQNKCCKKIKIIQDLTPSQQEVALRYFSNHYFAKQYVPYYDKEIFNVLESGDIKP